MKRVIPGFTVALGILVICGCAAAATVTGSTADSTAVGASERANAGDNAQVDLLDAEVASQRADWNISAELAEKSYRAKPDLWNEFNLATAYQHTNRGALAVPLYLDLVGRGQFARTHPIFSNDGNWPTRMRPFLADEAAYRLGQMGNVDQQTVAVTTPGLAGR